MRKNKLLLIICFAHLFIWQSGAQTAGITVELKNKTLQEAFKYIEANSKMVFFYNVKDVDLSRKVNIQARNAPVEKILDQLFKGTPNSYKIDGRQIFITKSLSGKDLPSESKPEQKNGKVRGKVIDRNGESLPGVTLQIAGSTRGVLTDENGVFEMDNVSAGTQLSVSFIGMETKEIVLEGKDDLIIVMEEKASELAEVTIVAFGVQKKESVVSSIQTINPGELRIPSSNFTAALTGRVAGMISYQTSGEPGYDNAQFFIRGITSFGTGKVNPLILIDNVEMGTDDLARLHPDDIRSFSILKDATATALYGARGANGVILITTKEGKEGAAKVSVRMENSFSAPTEKIEMADPITYMRLANEAALTRNPLSPTPYSAKKIENTISSTNPYVYPAVDWMNMLTKDMTVNQRANVNISGGGKVARYYIAGSLSQDNGILKVDKRNNFNNNIDLKKFLIRSNINIYITPSTEVIIRVNGTFDDYIGPIAGGSDLYQKILRVSPVRFPAWFEPDKTYSKAQHILFGGFEDDSYMNPYAEMLKGYREERKSVMVAQIEMKQDFSRWIKGLTARFLGNTTRNAGFDLTRAYSPFYYEVSGYDRATDAYTLSELNSSSGTEYLNYIPGYKSVSSAIYAEASAAYNRSFGRHGVSGMLVGILRNSLTGNAASLSESLQFRNLGLSGRFTYDYDTRYLGEFNFGYNGSEKFDKGHRWGFFPSVGLGWLVSNERFWKEADVRNPVSKLKLRATYGLVGNDEIGTQRFFYLSQVSVGGGSTFTSGYDFGKSRAGVRVYNYPNSTIGWEIAYKTNLGLELSLLNNKIEILADWFMEDRINILQPRADIPTSMGLWATPLVNVGKARGKGIDASIDYNQSINKYFWISGRGNFTYARSVYKYYEEPDYSDIPWKSKIGTPIKQNHGYVAERLFIDDADVQNSPRQDFGEYGPGDIKYKDINGDEVINEIDQVPIGYPTTPEINCGFGMSAGYRNFDISFFLTGSARSSFWINASAMSPFVRSSSGGKTLETGLARFIADDYWSEFSQNPDAAWPRLSNYLINNNLQQSTYFMQNGSFMRLKSVELGLSAPAKWLNSTRLETCRVYLSGVNLFKWSKFNLWDVEMGGNGLGYPIQRIINVGINIGF